MSVLSLRRTNNHKTVTFDAEEAMEKAMMEPQQAVADKSSGGVMQIEIPQPVPFYRHRACGGAFWKSKGWLHFLTSITLFSFGCLLVRTVSTPHAHKVLLSIRLPSNPPTESEVHVANLNLLGAVWFFVASSYHAALSCVPAVFKYYSIVLIREVNVFRAIEFGVHMAVVTTVLSMTIGERSPTAIITTATASFGCSGILLLSEHVLFYSRLLNMSNVRETSFLEVFAGIVLFFFCFGSVWSSVGLRSVLTAMHASTAGILTFTPILEFHLVAQFVFTSMIGLFSAMHTANWISYSTAESFYLLLFTLSSLVLTKLLM